MMKRIAFLALMALAVVCLTGCVKIIDKGTESQYTGEAEFDAAADSSSDWDQIVSEITENAVDIVTALDAGIGSSDTVPVFGTGTITEYVSKASGKKNSLAIAPDGYTGDATVAMQIGSIYTGTAIRDAQTLKNFESFTNQTEWSEYAKALNSEMNTQVVEPLALDASCEGKKITFVAVATASGSDVNLTPVTLTIE